MLSNTGTTFDRLQNQLDGLDKDATIKAIRSWSDFSTINANQVGALAWVGCLNHFSDSDYNAIIEEVMELMWHKRGNERQLTLCWILDIYMSENAIRCRGNQLGMSDFLESLCEALSDDERAAAALHVLEVGLIRVDAGKTKIDDCEVGERSYIMLAQSFLPPYTADLLEEVKYAPVYRLLLDHVDVGAESKGKVSLRDILETAQLVFGKV